MASCDYKEEAYRLHGPMHCVVRLMHLFCANPTGTVVDEGTLNEDGTVHGKVRLTVQVMRGHRPASHLKRFLDMYSASVGMCLDLADFKFNGLTRVRPEAPADPLVYGGKEFKEFTYEAEFSWPGGAW